MGSVYIRGGRGERETLLSLAALAAAAAAERIVSWIGGKKGEKAAWRNERRHFRLYDSQRRDGGPCDGGSHLELFLPGLTRRASDDIYIRRSVPGKLDYAVENFGVKTVSDCRGGKTPDFTKDAVCSIEDLYWRVSERERIPGSFSEEERKNGGTRCSYAGMFPGE